jgi:hypothetical protein
MGFQSDVVRFTAGAARLAAIAAIGLCVLSTASSAQTQPMPVLPLEPLTVDPTNPDETSAGAVGAASLARPQPWEYGLGVGAGWDSNIDFLVPDGASSTAISPRGNLARVFWGPKGELRLAGTGYWIAYLEQEGQSRYDATASLDGTYRSSLNTTWRARGSYTYGYSSSSTVLADQGVLLPVVPAQTITADLGVTRRLGARTSFRLDGRAHSTTFDETDLGSLGLVDGRSIRGTAALEKTIGSRDTTAIVYSLENVLNRAPGVTDTGSQSYLTHYGSLQWTHVLSPRSAFMLEAGSSYTPDLEQAQLGQRWSFYGGGSYKRKVKRSDFSLFARREVAPAFGLGVSRLETRFGLSATIPMGRAWTLDLAGTHVLPETPEGVDYSYPTPDEASASLGRRLGRLFEISAEGRYRRRSGTITYPAIEAFQVGLFLNLVSPNGRLSSRMPSR